MSTKNFWYIACLADDLRPGKTRPVEILGMHLALFRDQSGEPVALEDRCLHRNAQLSKGRVCNGQLVCPYHGWAYNGSGQVTDIPATCPSKSAAKGRQLQSYPTQERDGYIYVFLGTEAPQDKEPFSIPKLNQPGFHHIRLINLFDNTVTNCVENFVDIPHTVFVHPGIFRVRRNQRFTAKVVRDRGNVHVYYQNETSNLGFFSWFLNPSKREIIHSDHFFAPNITSVEYYMGPHRHFFITSQSIPVAAGKTLVYTDLTYDYGIWNRLAAPFVALQGQKIIDQDKVILKNQYDNILRSGEAFQNTSSDLIHVYIESIRHALDAGKDPSLLEYREKEIEFWV